MSTDVATGSRVVTGIGIGRGYAVAPLALLQPPPSIPADALTHDGNAGLPAISPLPPYTPSPTS